MKKGLRISSHLKLASTLTAVLFLWEKGHAGVTNPDISALGQLRGGITDDPGSENASEPYLALGEAEIVLTAALNPYLNGAFTLSGDEEGMGVEEAYATLIKGLPWGLGLKAGKYRLGFGKLNAAHPHAYPFIDPPHAWVSLVPGGEEGFNEAAMQVSALLPTPGVWASTLSYDIIEGKAFHPDEERTSLGGLGRWSNAFLFGDNVALESGLSAAWGRDAFEPSARGYVAGVDVKIKVYLAGASQLTLQWEGVNRHEHPIDPDGTSATDSRDRWGWFGLADYRFHTQMRIGLLAEQWEKEETPDRSDFACKIFAGYAVLEESTLLRVAYEYHDIAQSENVQTLSLQLLFSMGPHKAHTF